MTPISARRSKRRSLASHAITVGSRVSFVFGLAPVTGTVIEDRGDLGVGGRRLLRVRFEIEGAGEPFETEMPAEELTLAA